MGGDDSGMRRDAVLTLLALLSLAVVAVARSAPLTPSAIGVGVAGVLCLELLLFRRQKRVRAYWANPRVQATAVVGAVGGGVALTLLLGDWVLTTLLAGLCAYLLLLGAVFGWRRASREATRR